VLLDNLLIHDIGLDDINHLLL